MFGFGKKNKKPALVGAAEKRLKAQKYAKGFKVESKREGKGDSPVVGLAVVLGISIIAAYVLTEGAIKQGLGLRVGNPDLDKLLFGPGEPTLTGDSMMDYGLAIFLRGIFIFLLGGIVPGAAYMWKRMIDRADMNLYRLFWGTSITICVLFVLVQDSLVPLIKDIADIFF